MPEPGSPEWRERVAAICAQEAKEPEQYWYLSFADETFYGACVVKARGMTGAIQRSHALGINPGGQVAAFPVPPGCERMLPINELLSKRDLERHGDTMTLDEMEEKLGHTVAEREGGDACR